MPEQVQQREDVLFIQFAKSPVAGQVKTRMQPLLNARQACSLHIELLLWTCRTLTRAKLADVEVWVAGDSRHGAFAECAGMGATMRAQRGCDLGERMYDAMRDGLERYNKVILVGSDCPSMDAGYLGRAIRALEKETLVFGPAVDGGYVLVGARTIEPAVFASISWGSDRVYAQTLERLAKAGKSHVELQCLADIDRPEDLPHWQTVQNAAQ